jgi:hypothetical protein
VVKLGIICEGESEPTILDTAEFRNFLGQFEIELVGVVGAGGKKEYEAERIQKHRLILLDRGATAILVLVDLDKDVCITFTKEAVTQYPDQKIVVAVKEWENWYLADSQTLSGFVGQETVIQLPEQDEDPVTTIIGLAIASKQIKRFPKSKVRLAQAMRNNGFTIEKAARHPNCPSAQYFLSTLQILASAN